MSHAAATSYSPHTISNMLSPKTGETPDPLRQAGGKPPDPHLSIY